MGYYQGQRRRHKSFAVRTAMTASLCGLLTIGGAAMPPSLAFYGLSAPAFADPPDTMQGRTVSLDLSSADIHAVVSSLQQQTGAQIVIQDGGKPFDLVNLYLDHANLDKALRTIALSANAVISKNADGIYVFRHSDTASDTDNTVSAQDIAQAEATRKAYEASLDWRKLTLQHANPDEIIKTMRWPLDQADVNPYDTRLNQGTYPPSGLTITNSPGFSPAVIPQAVSPTVPIGHGTTGDDGANRAADSNQAGRSADTGNNTDQAQQFPGGGGGFGGGGGGFGGGGGGFGGGGGRGGFGGGGNQFGGGGGNQFGGGGNQFGGGGRGGAGGQNNNLPDGVDKIYALQGDNSLFIRATPQGFDTVKKIVRELDIAPRQVQIKVEFVSAQVNTVDQFGINFDIIPFPNVEAGNAESPGGNTFLNFAQGNLVAQLSAELSKTQTKVEQNPIITTTNNVTATIFSQQQIPYTVTTQTVSNGTVVSNTNTNFIQVPTQLSVSPRINSDDTITLTLNPTISQVGAAVANQAPAVSSQSVTTLRTVKNGETMVLGGLINKSETHTQTKVPILGDIPIIGSIFRTRNVQVNDTELLIFVTPTIIGETTNSAAGTAP